jgi:antitoxin MazE
MARAASLKIQKWGNSLAVRIPASLARRAGFQAGQPVEMSMQNSAVLVSLSGQPSLTLAQKLGLFDSQRHGGEVMATTRVGREVL